MRQRLWNHHRKIIFRKRGRLRWIVLGIAVQGQDAQRTTQLRFTKFPGFAFAQRTQFARPPLDNFAREMRGQRSSLRSRPQRIRKNVQVCERALSDELQCLCMLLLRFARKSGNDVSADRGVRQPFANQLDTARIMFRAIPAVHGAKNAVAGGLQRHMKMRRDAIGGRKQLDQILGHIQRFDGADAQALDAGFSTMRRNKSRNSTRGERSRPYVPRFIPLSTISRKPESASL